MPRPSKERPARVTFILPVILVSVLLGVLYTCGQSQRHGSAPAMPPEAGAP